MKKCARIPINWTSTRTNEKLATEIQNSNGDGKPRKTGPCEMMCGVVIPEVMRVYNERAKNPFPGILTAEGTNGYSVPQSVFGICHFCLLDSRRSFYESPG